MLCPCCNSENVRDTRDADIRKTHLFGEGRHESKGDYTCNNCGCSGDCEDFTPCDHGNATSMPVGKCAMTPECLLSLEQVDALNKTQPSAREILSGVPSPPQPLPPTESPRWVCECCTATSNEKHLPPEWTQFGESKRRIPGKRKPLACWCPRCKSHSYEHAGAEPLAAKEADPLDWWLIRFDDAEIPPQVIQCGDIARKAFEQHLIGWNCQLFKMVDDGFRREAAPPLAPQRKEK
jgi:hypothetical protein